MAKKKSLKVLSRNSYRGRVMGTLPAFVPGRCSELTLKEQNQIKQIHSAISRLINIMSTKAN